MPLFGVLCDRRCHRVYCGDACDHTAHTPRDSVFFLDAVGSPLCCFGVTAQVLSVKSSWKTLDDLLASST